MKLSTAMFLAAGVATLVIVGTAMCWITPRADVAAATSELTPAADEAETAVIEAVAIDASAATPRDAETEPLQFVGLHAGTLQCVASDYNLGLASIDGSDRAMDADAPSIGLVNFEPFATGMSASAANVPEPLTLSLLAFGSASILLHRGRRSA